MRIVRLSLGLVAVASIALTGCSKREDLKLAEIKDRVITVHDYEDAYARVKPEFLPKESGDKGKREFLDTMINRDVMAVKADELGYDKDPSVAQGMEAFRRMTCQIAYLRKAVGEIKVSDAEVKRYYDLQGTSVTFKRILCDRKEQADEAYEALKSGDDFTSVITRYSVSDDAKDGGTVTSAPFGALLPELDGAVFSQRVGGYTEPIYTPQGWVIIQVVKIDKRTGEPEGSYEKTKERIRTLMQNERETLAVNAFTDKLREKYGVTWNYDSMEIIFKALPPDKPVDQASSRDQEVYPLLYFEATDLDKPVVSFPGRTITIKDFSDLYDRASFYNRPRRDLRLGGIRNFLMLLIMNDISADAVAKSGIENDPEVKKLLGVKRDELMVNLMYEDLINKKTVIPEDRMRTFYNDNQATLMSPEQRNFGIVITSDQETALKAQEDMLAGKPMAVVSAEYSTDPETLEKKGQTGLVIRGQMPVVDNGFNMTTVGEVSTPTQVSNGWMVLKLMEISPARVYTFAESRERLEAGLREQENDKLLNEMLVKWKDEFKVVVHEENLKKVKLPVRQDQQIQDLKNKKQEVSKS